MSAELNNFFYPKSICLVGASSKEKSIGYEILRSVKEYSYSGSIFPVNPNAREILGYKCFKSILDIDEKIDLAIIIVPKKFVDESIEQLISKNVKSIILITAGFRETGEDGKKLENDLLLKLKMNNIRMVGPNCMGVINTLDNVKLNATFVAEQPEKGGIGFLSQSGALGAAVLNSLKETDIRFAHFISIGNKADISELDVLDFWLSDKNIRAITFYLESFENGLELIKKYKNAEIKKPLIVLKAGRTKSGIIAAASHTGALSNNEKITDALLKQFGIIRVNTILEMFNTAKGFERFPLPLGNKIAVITNAGGPAILAVDKLEERNLLLANLSELTKIKLKEIVHPEGSINNPIDLLPGGTPEMYRNVNEIVLEDENVDAIISIFVEPVMVDAFQVIESVYSIKAKKPIYQICMPLPEFWQKYSKNSVAALPVFRNPEDPAEIISNILLYKQKENHFYKFNGNENSVISEPKEFRFLNQKEVEKICKSYNIPIIDSIILPIGEIKKFDKYKFPMVLKGLSTEVIHKTESNAIKLNIKNKEELFIAADEIKNSFYKSGHNLDNLLIQPYIDVKHELLIGGFRDSSFGPIVMFGSGGKYVEVLDDTKIKSAYLNDNDLDDIISETKIGKIIQGIRGERGVDLVNLKQIIKSVASMIIENKNIAEIDLNPLVIDTKNCFYTVDARIKSF